MSTLATALLGMASAVMGVASTATMRGALERGDVDEASRQGMLAGVAVVEAALAADRTTLLAALTAVPSVEGRAELLPRLAGIAAGPYWRTAIPATAAALTVARELARTSPADDIAAEEVAEWRDAWAAIALDRARWVEVRVQAMDVAVELDLAATAASGTPTTTAGLGLQPSLVLSDPDPAIRIAALHLLPLPIPDPARPLVEALKTDSDPLVVKAAAFALCDSPKKCSQRRR